MYEALRLIHVLGTPQANRTSYNTTRTTPERNRDPYSRVQHDQLRQGAAHPTTFPLGTPPSSPGPLRAGPPRDAYYHTPQKAKNIPDSPSKPHQPLERPQNLDTSQTVNNGASNRPYLYHGNSPNKPLHVQVENTTSTRGGDGPPPPLPDPPAHYSPLKLTQYDKDVAMFKGPEPPSQVSSSTDSGYGHAHIYERVPGDTSGNISSKCRLLSFMKSLKMKRS